MREEHLGQLEKLGLSTAEAQIYLALVCNSAPMAASAIVAATGVPRSSVYPTLNRMADTGLIEAEAGYGGRFSAIPPERGLPSLIVREREELSERERTAEKLASELKSLAASTAVDLDGEQIQVIRDPRVAIDRFKRLQLEAKRQIDVFVKAPFFQSSTGNPTQEDMARRGIRGRGLYEREAVEHPDVIPHLARWISKGEEARVYDGELPHKLAIFDQQNILLPLVSRGGATKTLFIRHPQLAKSLGMLFDHLWQRSAPLDLGERDKPVPPLGKETGQSVNRQNSRKSPAKSQRSARKPRKETGTGKM